MSQYFVQSRMLCRTERSAWVSSQVGGGFLLMRNIIFLAFAPVSNIFCAKSQNSPIRI